MKYIICKDMHGYKEYPIIENCTISNLNFNIHGKKTYLNGKEIPEGEWTDEDGISVLVFNEKRIYYERKNRIFISDSDCDIAIPDCKSKIVIIEGQINIYNCNADHIYLNQKKVTNGSYDIEEGAVLLIEKIKVIISKSFLIVIGNDFSCNLVSLPDPYIKNDGFPKYKRSPRIIKRIENSRVKIEMLSKKKTNSKAALFKTILPPLGMLAVTLVMGFVLKRGAYIFMSAGATIMTTIISVVKFVQDKKEAKEEETIRTEKYENYLIQKQKEIYKLWISETEAYKYNYPEVKEICNMIRKCDSRIYERSSIDDDFLTVSIGTYTSSAAITIQDSMKDFEADEVPFREEICCLKDKYSMIQKPQIVDLKRTHLGLVGEKSIIHEQLKIILCQLAFSQSYHDMQIIAIYDEAYKNDFQWMRWLPHAKLQNLNILGLVHSPKNRDQVMSSLQQILKERKQKVEEEKKESRFLPHYVFVIDEPKILMDHSIMEFLGGVEGDKLGFSLIYTTHQQANLPDNIDTVFLLDNSSEGRLLLLEKELVERRLQLQCLNNVDLEWLARDLGILVHEQGMTSHIPSSITFFDMYQIRNPEELQIVKRWKCNNSAKTLSVPLGARAENDILELNLHEKAHGPHGLVAGTTGSGKSEIVQSYILSLAVNYHPHEVGFLLIDYKGGGMANLFKDLPHLLGTITNLDGSESMRALASIKAEIGRRERIFGDAGVNSINAYTDLYKEGAVTEPLPHLFIISDEFAELKREQPEFMKELVSVARVGRSIGIHLILATQKPTGVVDDQIWANSRFKLCLKVQNEADSKEILKTPDAANITQVGQAYLQVGNNEIYELFQSAWSGAKYIKETEKEVTQDNRVFLINDLGQGELINKDLRESREEQRARDTQLDVTVSYINQVYKELKAVEVKRPWLPSLPAKIVNPNIRIELERKLDLCIPIGVRDVPEEQKQVEYAIDLSRQGNVLYIASSGYGKTVFLENIALSLAAKNTVKNLYFYVLDFGNNALINISGLPHMASHIMLDEEEKFKKFLILLSEEIKSRKKKFALCSAQNFTVYNEIAEEKLAAIVILIDNFDAIREMDIEMESYFTKVTRDGVGLGIYFIATAGRSNSIRSATLNNFKNKIAGVNFDGNEARSLVGKCVYSLPDVIGRSIVKEDDRVSIMQLYSPVDFADDVELVNNVRNIVKEIKLASPEEAEHIPILPEEYNYSQLLSYKYGCGNISLGLEWENVHRVGMTSKHNPFLILGESGSGKTNVLKIILQQLRDRELVYLFDSKGRGLYEYQNGVHYINAQQQAEEFINYITEEVKVRKTYIDEQLRQGADISKVRDSISKIYVIIDEIDDFIDMLGVSNMSIAGTRLKNAMEYGVNFIVAVNVSKFNATDEFTKTLRGTRNGLLLSGQGFLNIFPVKVDKIPRQPDACLMLEGKGCNIRIPKFD